MISWIISTVSTQEELLERQFSGSNKNNETGVKPHSSYSSGSTQQILTNQAYGTTVMPNTTNIISGVFYVGTSLTDTNMTQGNYGSSTFTPINNSDLHVDLHLNNTITEGLREGYIHPLLVASRLVYKYGMTLIFILGAVGNFLVVITIVKGKTGQSSSSLYLIALAVLDQYNIFTAVLGSHMIRSYTGFDYIRSHPWACKWAYFSIVTCAQSSFWLVAAMSLERAIVLNFPLKYKNKFNRRTTTRIIVIIFVFWALKNLHMFWSQGAVYEKDLRNGTVIKVSNCGIVHGPTYHFNIRIRPWIDYVATFGAATVILISNFAIIYALFRSNKMHKTATVSKEGRSGSTQHRHMIAMLVTVSIAFLFLALPLQIITILVPRNPNDVRSNEAATADLLWSVGLLTNYGNNAVNFYLYCLSGTMFRKDLARLFRSSGKQKTKNIHSDVHNGTLSSGFVNSEYGVYIAKISESTRL